MDGTGQRVDAAEVEGHAAVRGQRPCLVADVERVPAQQLDLLAGAHGDGRLEITVPAVVHDPAESVEHPLAAGGDDGVRRARADDLDGPESVGLRKRGEGFGRIDAYPGLDVQHVAGGSGMRETHAGLLGDGAHDGLGAGGVAPVRHPGCPRCPWRREDQGVSRAQHGSDEQIVVRTASRRRRCPHVA